LARKIKAKNNAAAGPVPGNKPANTPKPTPKEIFSAESLILKSLENRNWITLANLESLGIFI
jgi:hypothetical protein